MAGIVSDLASLRQQVDALATAMPVASTVAPAPEVVSATAGTDPARFSQEGHAHPRLSSATMATTDAVTGITPQIDFTRSFAQMPCPVLCAINAVGVSLDVSAWVQDGSNRYIGARVRAIRRSANTTSSGVTVVGIPVLNGLTTTTADTPATSVLVSCVFLQQSA